MGIAHQVKAAIGHAIEGIRAGDDKLAWRKLCGERKPTIDVKSPAFEAGAPLPHSATSDGGGTPPPLEWGSVPAGARSLVVICEDPDAPVPEPFVHWLVYGIPPTARTLAGVVSHETWSEGTNGKRQVGFTGAAPPAGHGVHHYHFQVFALDRTLDLDRGEGRGALLGAMNDHVLAFGQVVGTYERT